jgi:ParB/RepB/Spo0J family partition protein
MRCRGGTAAKEASAGEQGLSGKPEMERTGEKIAAVGGYRHRVFSLSDAPALSGGLRRAAKFPPFFPARRRPFYHTRRRRSMSGNTQNAAEARGTVFLAPIEKIYYQGDRENGGDGDLEKLANSMARHGLINAITLCDLDSAGQYRIIAGRRRFEAAKRLGWQTIEAKVLAPSPLNAEELSLAENVNREDMNPLDEAELFAKRLADGADIKEVARYFNRSVSAIYQRVRLTALIPEIKTLFRDGKIAITAAALLAALEEKHQKNFYEKHCYYADITVGMAESFLHSVQQNTLAAIADKKCEGCPKRTNHTDKSLFPEETNLRDVCFDNDCYAKKWTALLEKTLKKAKAKEGDTKNMVILNGVPKFYKGKIITLDKTDYEIKKYDYYQNEAREGDPNAFYVWRFDVTWSSKLGLRRQLYKEAEKKTNAEQKKNKVAGLEYAPEEAIEKVIDEVIGPEAVDFKPEERTLIAKDIGQAVKKRYGSNYSDSLNDAIFKKIILRRLENPKDLTREYVSQVMDWAGSEQKEIYALITGLPYSKDLAGLETLAPEKLVTLLFALHMIEEGEDMPEPGHAEANDPPLQFGGLNVEEYKELYNATAAELIADAVAHQDDPEPEETGDDGEAEDDGEEQSG